MHNFFHTREGYPGKAIKSPWHLSETCCSTESSRSGCRRHGLGVPAARWTTSPGCLAPGALHGLSHREKTKQEPCRTDSSSLPTLSTAPEAAKSTRMLRARGTGCVPRLPQEASWRSRAVAMPLETKAETCCKPPWLQQRAEPLSFS